MIGLKNSFTRYLNGLKDFGCYHIKSNFSPYKHGIWQDINKKYHILKKLYDSVANIGDVYDPVSNISDVVIQSQISVTFIVQSQSNSLRNSIHFQSSDQV